MKNNWLRALGRRDYYDWTLGISSTFSLSVSVSFSAHLSPCIYHWSAPWHQQHYPESHCPLITNRKEKNLLKTSINIIRIQREVSDLIWNGNSEFAQGWDCASANIEFVFCSPVFSISTANTSWRDAGKMKKKKTPIWHKYNSRYWRFLVYTHRCAEHGDTCVCVWSRSLFSREYGIQQLHQMINDVSVICRMCGVILRCFRSCHGKTLPKKNSDLLFLCHLALTVIGARVKLQKYCMTNMEMWFHFWCGETCLP